MINQWVLPGMHRLLARACVLVLAVVGLLLSGVPASQADGDGLLGDTVQIVGATAEQVVEPAAPVTQPVQQPVEQAVESVVGPAVAPAQQTVEAVVRVVEQAAEPVVKAVEPAVHRAGETGAKTVEPVVESAPAPVAPHAPVTGEPNDSPTGGVSDQGGAQPDAGAKGPTREQRRADAAGRALRTDLARRAVGGPVIVRNSGSGSGEDQAEGEALWALTNELMQLWAGDPAPNAVNSGLPGGGMGALTLWRAPLLLGLLLGFLSLVLSRRRLG